MLLRGLVRHYDWGSRTALAELTGRPVPTPLPEAELWFGAHPTGSATFADGSTLADHIGADPRTLLGPAADRYGAALPLLLKVLAADRALSIQVHPGAEQARTGFVREDAAGVPFDSPHRTYRDDRPKPELVVALTEFDALAGFRDEADVVALFDALGLPEFEDDRARFASGGPAALLARWLTLGAPELTRLLNALVDGCHRLVSAGSGFAGAGFVSDAATIVRLAAQYPGDAGVLVALLLQHTRLAPGAGLFLDAGVPHAYLRGVAVEVMTNSDNVIRGGLTTKHVDVPELLRITRFGTGPVPIANPVPDPDTDRVLTYPTPNPDFSLARIELGDADTTNLTCAGPAIVLCTAGSVTASCGGTLAAARCGDAVWVPAGTSGTRRIALTGSGTRTQLFAATVPSAAAPEGTR